MFCGTYRWRSHLRRAPPESSQRLYSRHPMFRRLQYRTRRLYTSLNKGESNLAPGHTDDIQIRDVLHQNFDNVRVPVSGGVM